MKLIIIVPDGMADRRYPELGYRSPVEFARTPALDEIVRRGHTGLAQTMYPGLPLGSLVGLFGILGYHPPSYFPLGRSVFEARVLGVPLSPADLVCRCNIIRVDDAGRIADFTAGQIGEDAARAYLQELRIPDELAIYHDLSYRNVLVHRACLIDDDRLELFEPHENVGGKVAELVPRYRGEVYEPYRRFLLESRRGDLMLWLWGASRDRTLPPSPYRIVTVTALSFLAGLTRAIGGTGIMPPGATGYLNSGLATKVHAALEQIDRADVCLIHCNAPDEESHVHNLPGKVQAIEDIDRLVIAPLIEYLDRSAEQQRLWVLPDHFTVGGSGRHLPDLVPYAVCGPGIGRDSGLCRFSEIEIAARAKDVPALESYQIFHRLLESAEIGLPRGAAAHG